MFRFCLATALLSTPLVMAFCWVNLTHAQPTEEVPFITSPDNVTLEMLSVADVKRGDHVIDLDSGDGRIVILAAKRFEATGLGMEIDPTLVARSQNNSREKLGADSIVDYQFNQIRPKKYDHMTAAHIAAGTLTSTRVFARRVAHIYPTQMAVLLGARAPGSEHDENDADVTTILRSAFGPFIKTKMAMNDMAYDIRLATGIRMQPPSLRAAQWTQSENYSNPHSFSSFTREETTP